LSKLNLQSLALRRIHLNPRFADEDIAHFILLRSLTHLFLGSMSNADGIYNHIHSLRSLQSIHLHNQFSLSNLSFLVNNIEEMKSVKSLALNYWDNLDAGNLIRMLEHSTVTRLILYQVNFSELDARNLLDVLPRTKLSSLTISYKGTVTKQAITALVEAAEQSGVIIQIRKAF
jgi:hypothetical protein